MKVGTLIHSMKIKVTGAVVKIIFHFMARMNFYFCIFGLNNWKKRNGKQNMVGMHHSKRKAGINGMLLTTCE